MVFDTLVLTEIFVEVVIVVEVAEHDCSVAGNDAGLVDEFIHVLDVDEVRSRMPSLPPAPVNLITCHF